MQINGVTVGGGSTPLRVLGLTLSAAGWTLSGGYYTYPLSAGWITANSDVSATPQNASYQTAYNANILPYIAVASGVATFYAQFPPQADIVVNLVITETI
jgi:hypothetical protein